tara:strand:- start:336 stop:572 length:237 start_codon:yes stop_codon:yes gene_type:complete
MSLKFEFGTTEKLFERVSKDKDMMKVVSEVIALCKTASEKGIPMDELASACTMGWLMGQDPEVKKVYDFIIARAKTGN